MIPIVAFAIAGLTVMLTLFVYAVGSAVHEHFSPSPAPVPGEVDD